MTHQTKIVTTTTKEYAEVSLLVVFSFVGGMLSPNFAFVFLYSLYSLMRICSILMKRRSSELIKESIHIPSNISSDIENPPTVECIEDEIHPIVNTLQIKLSKNYKAKKEEDQLTKSSESPKAPAVTFYEKVTVYKIPSFNDYTPDVRSRLWSSSSEISENMLRNLMEFKYDGENWRKATEETDMLRDKATNELCHPVHFHLRPWSFA